MHDVMDCDTGLAPPALLAPTRALLLGFEFDAPQAPVAAALPRQAAAAGVAAGPGVQLRQGFRVGSVNLMIRYEDGSELTDMPALHRLPNAPAWLPGMTNLHGTLVTVFDPAVLFDVAHDAAAKPMLLVLGHGDEKAGMLIDGLPQRLRPTAQTRLDQAVVPAALANCVDEVHRIDGVDWMDFRYPALFERLEAELAQ